MLLCYQMLCGPWRLGISPLGLPPTEQPEPAGVMALEEDSVVAPASSTPEGVSATDAKALSEMATERGLVRHGTPCQVICTPRQLPASTGLSSRPVGFRSLFSSGTLDELESP